MTFTARPLARFMSLSHYFAPFGGLRAALEFESGTVGRLLMGRGKNPDQFHLCPPASPHDIQTGKLVPSWAQMTQVRTSDVQDEIQRAHTLIMAARKLDFGQANLEEWETILGFVEFPDHQLGDLPQNALREKLAWLLESNQPEFKIEPSDTELVETCLTLSFITSRHKTGVIENLLQTLWNKSEKLPASDHALRTDCLEIANPDRLQNLSPDTGLADQTDFSVMLCLSQLEQSIAFDKAWVQQNNAESTPQFLFIKGLAWQGVPAAMEAAIHLDLQRLQLNISDDFESLRNIGYPFLDDLCDHYSSLRMSLINLPMSYKDREKIINTFAAFYQAILLWACLCFVEASTHFPVSWVEMNLKRHLGANNPIVGHLLQYRLELRQSPSGHD